MNWNMKKSRFKTVLVSGLAVILLSVTCFSNPLIVLDKPMPLESLITLALDNEANHRSVVENEKIVGMLKLSAVGQFLPTVTIGGSWGTRTDIDLQTEITNADSTTTYVSIDRSRSDSGFDFSISQNIFQGGSNFFGLKGAKLQVENLFLNSEQSRDGLIAQVKTSFYNLLAAEENLKVQNEILAQRQEAHRLANARYATGDVIELDVMQADIDVGTQENMLLEAVQAVENAREALNLTIGLDLNSKFPLDGKLDPVIPETGIDAIISSAFSNQPGYKRIKNNVKIAKYNVKREMANYLPSISGYYRSSRFGFEDGKHKYELLPSSKSNSIGLNARITIFDGFNREYRKQNAVIQRRNAEYTEQATREQLKSNLGTQWRTLVKLDKQILVSLKNRELARRQLELEQERYRVGASNQLSLRSAQVTLISAEQSYISLVLNFYVTLSTLERDTGVALSELGQ
jgi:outer membrane protein